MGDTTDREGIFMGLGISIVISSFNRTDLFLRNYPTWFEGKTWPDEVHVLNDGGDPSLEGAVDEMVNRYPEISIHYTYRDKGHNAVSYTHLTLPTILLV